jgi:Holliday junction resolvase-like predicted endonuclease
MGIGTQGENLVADWLVTKQAVVLQRRWRKRSAEVDLIAQKADGTLLFIEVKTRSAQAAENHSGRSSILRLLSRTLWLQLSF